MRPVLCLLLFTFFLVTCKKSSPPKEPLSSDKEIISFQFRPQENPGLTDTINGMITGQVIIVSYGGAVPLNALKPYIIYKGSSINPSSGVEVDFTNYVTYTVQAEDSSSTQYRVVVSANKLLYIGSSDGYVYAIDAAIGEQIWKFNAGGAVYSNPTLANGIVYVGSTDQHIYAIDSATGTEKWKVHYDRPINSTPTVSDETVYLNPYGFVMALDAETGSEKWRYQTYDHSDFASPTVAEGKVFIQSPLGLYNTSVLNASTGEWIWGVQGGIGATNPTVVNGVVYIGGEIYKVIALDANTGTIKWKHDDGDNGSNTCPTVADGKVFVGGADGSVCAFDAQAGTLLWKKTPYSSFRWSSPVYGNGLIFLGNTNNINYAFDAATGNQVWATASTIITRDQPSKATVANGTVIFGGHDGNVVAHDALSGKVKWKFKTGAAVYSGACIVGVSGEVFHPGDSGDNN